MNILQIPLPPYLQNPQDSSSKQQKLGCLAWHLMRKKTVEGLNEYLGKQTPKARAELNPFLIYARAWIWLHTLTSQEIHHALPYVHASEREILRSALNQLKPHLRKEAQP